MGAKNIPEDTDGRMLNSVTGQRNRGALTRMSIDTTTEEKREFLIEAVEHNMTLRGYFYHCWRNSQKYEKLHEDGADAGSLADKAVRNARERLSADK